MSIGVGVLLLDYHKVRNTQLETFVKFLLYCNFRQKIFSDDQNISSNSSDMIAAKKVALLKKEVQTEK